MKKREKLFLTTMILLQLAGCMNDKKAFPNDPAYAPTPPRQMPAPPAQSGSIYQVGYDRQLFQDRKARQIGDILTIRLVEQTQSTKSADTKTTRTSVLTNANPTVLGSQVQFNAPGVLPLASNKNANLGTSVNDSNAFQGQATADQANALTGFITVTVSDVLNNGYLVVRGEKWVNINQGDEYIRITGIVRPEDIDANNQVDSTRVGNARVTYSGTGDFADSSKQPWISKFFSSLLWPF